MAEKTTHGNPEFAVPSADELLSRVKDRARAHGSDPVDLAEDQLKNLQDLSGGIAEALGGDERVQAHLEAQFKLARFSAEAEAYLNAVAWRKAIVEVLTEIIVQAGQAAIAAAAQGLVGALNAGMEG